MESKLLRTVLLIIGVTGAAISPRLSGQEHPAYTILVLEYVWPYQDKPVTPVLITDVKERLEWFRDRVKSPDNWESDDVYVVSPSFMDSLNSLAKKIPSSPTPHIALTVVTPTGRATRHFDADRAVSLLEGFKGLCMQHPGLYAAVRRFERNSLPAKLIPDY